MMKNPEVNINVAKELLPGLRDCVRRGMNVHTQKAFVKKYIQENFSVDVCDQDFHDQFHKNFGGERNLKTFGAQPVIKAQRLLALMYKEGTLRRDITSINGLGSGFPNWVYVYRIA